MRDEKTEIHQLKGNCNDVVSPYYNSAKNLKIGENAWKLRSFDTGVHDKNSEVGHWFSAQLG